MDQYKENDPLAAREIARRVARVLLERTLEDLTGAFGIKRATEARAWLERGTVGEYPFSMVCDALDLVPEAVRESAFRTLEKERAKIEADRRARDAALAEVATFPEEGFSAETIAYLTKVIGNFRNQYSQEGGNTGEVRREVNAADSQNNARNNNSLPLDAARLVPRLREALHQAREILREDVYRNVPGDPDGVELPIRSGREKGLDTLLTVAAYSQKTAAALEQLPAEYRDELLTAAAEQLKEVPFEVGSVFHVLVREFKVRAVLSDVLEALAVGARMVHNKLLQAGGRTDTSHAVAREHFMRQLLFVYLELTGEPALAVTKGEPRFWQAVRFVEALTPTWLNPAHSRAEYMVRKLASAGLEQD